MSRLAALILIAAFVPVLAAPAEQPRPLPRKLLSRAELRVCIVREQQLTQRQVALKDAQNAQLESSAQLSAEAMALSHILRTLDSSDEAAVESYNRRNEARNLEVVSHNKRAEILIASLGELQSDEADYMAACVSRPFLKSDQDAVLKELGIRQRPQRRDISPTRPVREHEV
jgi:hypothetical protein